MFMALLMINPWDILMPFVVCFCCVAGLKSNFGGDGRFEELKVEESKKKEQEEKYEEMKKS